MKCCDKNCDKRFHVTCAMLNSKMVVLWQPKICYAYCKEHCPQDLIVKAKISNCVLLYYIQSYISPYIKKCSICNNIYSESINIPTIECKNCHIIVHKDCYGVLDSSLTSDFYCSYCKTVEDSTKHPICEICNREGGAFKPTTNGKWIHLYCALWIPSLSFIDILTLQPVVGLEAINPLSKTYVCQICNKAGLCIQCNEVTCNATYHPLCARDAGYLMIFKEKKDGEIRAISYCNVHTNFESILKLF